MKWITGTIALWAVTVILAANVPVAAQIGGRPARPQVIPPQGPVRQVIIKNCTSCHGIDDYAFNSFDRAGWSAYIDAKHQTQKVSITGPDRELLLDWLVSKFGPGTKAFPRTYIAQEVTTFFTDAEAEELLKRACASCHALDRVNDSRFSPDRWRVVTVDMRERGAKIDDDELERLVVAWQNEGDEPEPMKPLSACALVVALSMATARVATQADETIFNAVSANVAQPGGLVKIRIQRWSTPEQATPLIAALNPPPPAAPRGAGAEGARAGGRGDAAGRAGRAGFRGRGRGAAPAAPLSPTAALTQAIGRAPTIGYLWTSEVTGYAIKYAYRAPLPDGGERVILASDRRLGTYTAAWQPTVSNLTDYEFTVIEIRFDAKGVGEGKTSLTTKVIVDNEAKTLALENYITAAPILRNVKRS